ncbi:MAG: ribose 5-phosphate isomerase B [Deltaproteobacteria bacterium]|nr:ribose 5-phosphate isomerase B [Myxococcales bacterium]MCZ6569376.1 ribose 5-phosphate isomerase B [Deltaproteobacteria bacterium]MCZ6715141.1 ribose 5-phosphate isomerase B [Deltaproteobacteria bacterium]MCZ6823810.1 ribose 5-phosphate isomerase B [Deltaproteobacteria bacterium]TDJ02184.1 MAG: ribose 5-phosphate isomerase B [Deltaproteobacteria bacterium]
MRIAVAADHAGFEFKTRLIEELRTLGHMVADEGTDSPESCDYPDYAIPAARSVSEGKSDRAILVCSNGIGMGMVANRIPGVRAAVVYSERTAEMTRGHNNSNVLCLGAQQFPEEDLLKFVRIWLDTDFEGGRHARRMKKVRSLE